MDIPFLRSLSVLLTLALLESTRPDTIPFLHTPLASSSRTAHSCSPPPMTFLTFSFNGSSSILLITPKACFFQLSIRHGRLDQLCTKYILFLSFNHLTEACEAASSWVSAYLKVSASLSSPNTIAAYPSRPTLPLEILDRRIRIGLMRLSERRIPRSLIWLDMEPCSRIVFFNAFAYNIYK